MLGGGCGLELVGSGRKTEGAGTLSWSSRNTDMAGSLSLSLRGGDGKKMNSFGSGEEGTTGGLFTSSWEGLLDGGGGVGLVGKRFGPRSSSSWSC